MYKNTLYVIFTALLCTFSVKAQHRKAFHENVDLKQKQWADSVLKSFTLDQKLGQLFVISAYSNGKDTVNTRKVADLVKNYNIGGVCFLAGTLMRQANLTNYFQSLAHIPLMISIDGEWGLAMRIDSTMRFPRQMTLGAINKPDKVYAMATEIAKQCKRMGIHVNFAPVVDVNNNPLNPVIGSRSFSESKQIVTQNGLAYMRGLQDNSIMACAKHFPGHGNTTVDSHKALPIISQKPQEMDTLELYPFKALINNGVSSMMVAHLFIPGYDSVVNTATTLSKKVVTDLLKDKMHYNGLVFTDALNMKAVSGMYEAGKVDVKALLAGNDVLLFTEDVPAAIKQIKAAMDNKELTEAEIDLHVRKILEAKYWCGLNKYKPIDIKNLYEDLNRPSAKLLNQQLFESANTVLKNKGGLLPLRNLDKLTIASLIIGDSIGVPFNNMLGNYAPIEYFQLNKDAKQTQVDSIATLLKPYNTLILSIHNTTSNPEKQYGITEAMVKAITVLKEKRKLIVNIFGNPYTLSRLTSADEADALIMSYEGPPEMQNVSAQMIFGAVPASGKLPVSTGNSFKIADGVSVHTINRLKYTIPEEVGIASADMVKIDSLVMKAIRIGATPGCQVLVAKDGKVIYNKAFGYQTYEKKQVVKATDIYDIASITKIASTTLALMDLYNEGKLKLDNKLPKFLGDLKKTNKKDIVLRDMLAHQAGLVSWIPFYKNTCINGELSANIYSKMQSSGYPIKVADNLYITQEYTDSIWDCIKQSPVSKEKKYEYSDLGFIMAKRIVEKFNKEPIQTTVNREFYKTLGLSTMGFLPKERFKIERIVPTELDKTFRGQLLRGDVHDPAAAMLGGIAGHAGLFSNANDLAIIMQMLLNKGYYGGRQYLKSTTVEEFTRTQFPQNKNRRGLGFDKADGEKGPTCKSASPKTFGHQGFTGTCVWADPQYNIVYVFLSNRVNPDAENTKLVKMNIRTDIQQVVYDALKK